MKPVKTGQANFVYRGPRPDIGDLWVQRVDGTVRTVWEFTDEERELIAAGGRIELAMFHEPIPPISFIVLSEEQSQPVDEHGWKGQTP